MDILIVPWKVCLPHLRVIPVTISAGNNDNDDSGVINYLSIRYNGHQSSVENQELNGLSMGGVGRETDVDYLEIFCNVDDGIETWGGAVNYKHVAIWNVGDDSMDFDCGWRGKAQFGLIVQGYSAVASQGSGVGDNMFEHDGAEDSDAQPVTTGVIANFTAIGQGKRKRRRRRRVLPYGVMDAVCSIATVSSWTAPKRWFVRMATTATDRADMATTAR